MSTQTEPKLVTQIDFARAGQITPQMKEVAEREHRDPEYIRERVADGRIAIPANIVHIKKGMRAFGVGEGLSTKVNVNLGISGDKADAAEEWKKVKIAEDFGADAIMDLSNSGKTREIVELTQLAHNLNPHLKFIVITGNPDSPLAQESDVCLSTGSPKEVCILGMTPTTSTTVMTVIGDILVVQTMQRTGFTIEDYSKRHHGGYLGEKSRLLCVK